MLGETSKVLLDDLVSIDWSKNGYDKLKDGYLRGGVTYEEWVEYLKQNPDKVNGRLRQELEQIIKIEDPLDQDQELNKLAIAYKDLGKSKTILQKQMNSMSSKQASKNLKEETPYFIFEKEGQALEFIKRQPLFFDKSEMWWLWEHNNSKYGLTDKTQILMEIKDVINANVINSKERTEILNALQIVGRKHMPKEIPKECIQFKDKIINIKTGEESESTPEVFSTNPIPWSIGESDSTPTMDKYFEEWVGKKYVQTLYEILAYSVCSDQFMQRMIALVGGGSNGKGTFIKLLKQFVGKENCVSSELKVLSDNIFETSALYKKLVCEMGEVSHDDLKNTNQLKKLSGQDDIRYCFKGKTAFTDESQATCLINTNSLPVSRDKTAGFYRRWLIVDFPNQFPIKEGLIESIPDKEFENLARKSIEILKEMYESYKFTNEGDLEERANRYEERSNPVMRFVEEYCEEDYERYVSLKEFSRIFNKYLKDRHLRSQNTKEIKKSLSEEGFEVSRTRRNNIRDIYILNLKINLDQLVPIVQENENRSLRKEQIEKNGTIGTIGTKQQELPKEQEDSK